MLQQVDHCEQATVGAAAAAAWLVLKEVLAQPRYAAT